MKGDYAKITYRHPTGVAVEKVQATRDGATVLVSMPQRGDNFVSVEEISKVNKTISISRFLASEVLSIVEGHETLQRAKKR